MRILQKTFVVLVLMLSMDCVGIYAQQTSDSLAVYFRRGYSTFDRSYRNNGSNIDAFIERIKSIQEASHLNICKVEYFASTSPEGSVKANENLARKRASNLTSILRNDLVFPDSLVSVTTNMGDWTRLASLVSSDESVPCREEALEIIESDDPQSRQGDLEALSGGKTWDYLLRTHFPDLRSFRVFISVGFEKMVLDENVEVEDAPQQVDQTPIEIVDEQIVVDTISLKVPESVVEPEPDTMVQPGPAVEQTPEWSRKLTVKTNVLGWGFLMCNAAVEVDIIENLSFSLPVYYSGWDYFTPTMKFRTLMIQPELKYYIPRTRGLYVGAHFGLGYWNFALGELGERLGFEDWRYQDHAGESPAIGGGISVGYALQFRKNPRWGMEFSLGAGVYDSKYDVFYNEANGPYHKRGLRTLFIGVDNAAVSFTYKFDLKKKEGGR